MPWWVSGVVALSLLGVLTLLPLLAMLIEAGNIAWHEILNSTYTQRVIRFSFWQATLSTALSLTLALPVALSLAHLSRFPGRQLIVLLFSLSLVIPTIVAIFGIVAVFGRTGWLSAVLINMSLPPLDFYGLPGILLAHVFFNMPLAARVLLISLEGIPQEQWRLAAQLGMNPLQLYRFIEWPAIRGQLAGLALLIFMLCFTSFAIVMTIGGGPRATTIEVAIYQALRFDFDIAQAVALACIQLLVCISLMAITAFFKQDNTIGFESLNQQPGQALAPLYELKKSLWSSPALVFLHGSVIAMTGLFIASPLMALLLSSMNAQTWSVLTDSTTLTAVRNTVMTALCSAMVAVSLAVALLASSRHLRIRLHRDRAGQWLQLTGNVILVIPPLVLGTGLFLLLRPVADVFSIALLLVVIVNSLMALPFVIRILEGPMMRTSRRSDILVQSLGIRGLSRWRWIDWPQLKKPVGMGFALSATLSAGDLSAIALFGSERATTLPLLLYQRMGSYRLDQAAVTAGILLVLCLVLFATLQRLIGGSEHADSQ